MVDTTTRPQGVTTAGEPTTSVESSEDKPVLTKQESVSEDGAQCLELTSPISQTSTVDTPSSADNGLVQIDISASCRVS